MATISTLAKSLAVLAAALVSAPLPARAAVADAANQAPSPAAVATLAAGQPAPAGKSAAPQPAASPKAATETAAEPKPSGATRVAILNFGAPSSWQGEIDDTIGIQVNAKCWKDVIPLLEKDKVDVVVVRINSGGGMLLELEPFNKVFQEEYKKRFRTVGWVESAISAAAMSPWVLEEFYFFPNGNIGACTGWSGSLVAMKGWGLEMVLARMEEASRLANRDPKIMRSMQIQEPLSCNVDPKTGEVTYFQDTTGEILINPEGQVLTLTAPVAMQCKFGRGIASTKEELAKAMGLQEVEWVGQKASDFVDANMRLAHKADKDMVVVRNKYAIQLQFAEGAQDRKERSSFVGVARRYLNEIRGLIKSNPNIALMQDLTPEWFEEQERTLRDLAR